MKKYRIVCLLAAALAAASPGLWAAPPPADGQVAYLQLTDDGCRVGVWDSKTRTSRIVGAVPECPVAVSVTSHEQVLVLIYPSSIKLVDLNSGKIGDAIPMPAEVPTKSRDTEASLAGYTADGTLALYLRSVNRDNSSTSLLFLSKGGAWKKAAERACGDYQECTVQPAIEARQLDDIYGLGPHGLFDQSPAADPYIVQRSAKDARPDAVTDSDGPLDLHMHPATVTLTFQVDGKDSQLVFNTAPGEDTDGVYTFGLKLKLPDARMLTIVASDQFGAALVGHYLLYHGYFGNGLRLYDVGNGEVVLDNLVSGGWLETSPSK